MSVSNPVLVFSCDTCGVKDEMPLRCSEAQLWARPDESEMLVFMKTHGFAYDAQSKFMYCQGCEPQMFFERHEKHLLQE